MFHYHLQNVVKPSNHLVRDGNSLLEEIEGGGMGGNLGGFKIVYKIFNWPAGAPRSPKAAATQAIKIYGALPHTLLKGAKRP